MTQVMPALKVVRVVAPLDGSDTAAEALPAAESLAALFAAPLHLVRVVDPQHLDTPLNALLQGDALALALAVEMERESARQALATTAAGLAQRADTATVEVREGDAATEILAAVQPGDLLVMSTHGRSGPARWVLGSVAETVIRRAAAPVWLVRAGGATPSQIQRLVVPLDGSARAEAALPAAAELATRLHLPVHLLTVLDISAGTTLKLTTAALMAGHLEDEVMQLHLAAEHALADGLVRLPQGITTSTDVRVGRPAAAIREAVRPGDLVVMTSHGRSGMARVFLGSVAEEVVRHAPAPVLLIRAELEATA